MYTVSLVGLRNEVNNSKKGPLLTNLVLPIPLSCVHSNTVYSQLISGYLLDNLSHVLLSVTSIYHC